MNLTETKEADEVMKRHIEDSLAILPPIRTCYSLQSSDQISLIDVGSGASLSGLVLAIACPGALYYCSNHDYVVFLDLLKKANFFVSRLESYSTGVYQ